MGYTPQSIEQLCALAGHLSVRRDAVLQAWRTAVDRDPQLTTASTISRAQFNDHIPEVLDAFERQLRAHNPAEHAQAREEEKESAAGHGLHRWQQGYDQRETMCEWGHLQLCLLDELEQYGVQHPQLESSVMPIARRALTRLCSDGVCASVARYTHLQQSEAASRLRDLEVALAQLTGLEQQRAETWREAAHDLRGTANVIANASAVLLHDSVPDAQRTHFSTMLQRGVASLNKLLTDLMDHARLEAGQERRHVGDFDAAAVLKEFCETMRPLAIERNLFFKCEGPAALPVQGDMIKVQRIAQNLVLNALKATRSGGIKVVWGECGTATRPQWMLYVQDTGPGFQGTTPTPLERVLKQATREAREVLEETVAAPTVRSQSAESPDSVPSGEGIGLSIVKRLCELLDASLELETAAGKGTTFRVTFPLYYRDT
jgi:signal transduction histidine kinase